MKISNKNLILYPINGAILIFAPNVWQKGKKNMDEKLKKLYNELSDLENNKEYVFMTEKIRRKRIEISILPCNRAA